jgi:hypothetical protein
MKKERSAAILSIKDADKMSKKGRKAIAKWLQMHAQYLLQYGPNYAGRFRARYIY